MTRRSSRSKTLYFFGISFAAIFAPSRLRGLLVLKPPRHVVQRLHPQWDNAAGRALQLEHQAVVDGVEMIGRPDARCSPQVLLLTETRQSFSPSAALIR